MREGDYSHRFDRMERDMEAVKEELTKMPIQNLTDAIEHLTSKIEVLATSHLKIIYWLLILVSTAFLGTKGVEIFKMLHAVTI